MREQSAQLSSELSSGKSLPSSSSPRRSLSTHSSRENYSQRLFEGKVTRTLGSALVLSEGPSTRSARFKGNSFFHRDMWIKLKKWESTTEKKIARLELQIVPQTRKKEKCFNELNKAKRNSTDCRVEVNLYKQTIEKLGLQMGCSKDFKNYF